MKLHSPGFEKGLRRKVRRAIKGSPELKREFRAARKFRKQYHITILARPLVSLGLALGILQIWEKTNHVASAFAVISLWCLVFVFLHAQRLITSLYGAADLQVFGVLPIPESTVFKWELQRFFVGTIWAFADICAAYAAIALRGEFSLTKWCAVVPLSIATWIEAIALAALCVAHFPRFPYQLASSLLILSIFVLAIARDFVGLVVVRLIDACATNLNLVLPTGWPVSLSQGLLFGDAWAALGFLVPTGVVIWSLKDSLSRLASDYLFKEKLLPEAPDLVPGISDSDLDGSSSGSERPARLGQTAIEEIVQTRKFLAPPDWGGPGWLEATFWRWCSKRERVLAEFVFPNGLAFSKGWRSIFRNLVITCVAALACGLVSPAAEMWLFGVGLFIAVCQVLAHVLATGRAFQLVPCSGVNIHLYASYPVGFCELGVFLFKYSLSQAPVVLLFSLTSSIVLFHICGLSLVLGAWAGLKVTGLLVVSRFLFLAFGFSSGTNDTSRIRVRSMLLILLAIAFGVGFAALGGASLLLPNQIAAWLCLGAAALDAYVFFRLYGWFYNRNMFDLMSLPRH